jgi:hypothetical protein
MHDSCSYGREADTPIQVFKAWCCTNEGITQDINVRLQVSHRLVTGSLPAWQTCAQPAAVLSQGRRHRPGTRVGIPFSSQPIDRTKYVSEDIPTQFDVQGPRGLPVWLIYHSYLTMHD